MNFFRGKLPLFIFSFLLVFFVAVVYALSPFTASDYIGQNSITGNYYGNVTPNTKGFDNTYDTALDPVNHLLFVSEYNNNRILVHQLDTDNTIIDQDADYVIGQDSFSVNSCNKGGTASASTLCNPVGLEIDTTNHLLFVADQGNKRVLVYNLNSSNIPADTTADYVFGQGGSFTTTASNVTATGMSYPFYLALDNVNNRLFVSEGTAHRVLAFDLNSSNVPVDTTADYVFGQGGNFTTSTVDYEGSVTANGLENPNGLAIDTVNNHLFVADSSNSRVLQFILSGTGVPTNTTADFVFMQANLTSETCAVGSYTASNGCNPRTVEIDVVNNILHIADSGANRVTSYLLNSSHQPDNIVADYVLGQGGSYSTSSCANTATGLCQPYGITLDETNNLLIINDKSYNRVLFFNLDGSGLPTNATADEVLGQPSFTTAYANYTAEINATGFSSIHSIIVDETNNKLFVSDDDFDRILVFNLNSSNVLADKTADYVIGQSDFVTDNGCDTASATNMCAPSGMALDSTNNRLFVADRDYNRILVFNLDSTNTPVDTTADYVLGQGAAGASVSDVTNFSDSATGHENTGLEAPKFVTLDSTNNRLFVSDSANHRVVYFNLSSTNIPNNNVIDGVLGQDNLNNGSNQANKGSTTTIDSMSNPRGLVIDNNNNRLFVVDRGNHRILAFNLSSLSNGMDASYFFGQPIATTGATGLNIDLLDSPHGLSFNSETSRLFVVDENNSRVIVHNVTNSVIASSQNAEAVLGQDDFTSSDTGNTSSNLSTPYGVFVATDANRVYVADTGNYRGLIFYLPKITSTSLTAGTVGTSYSQTVATSNTQGTKTFAVISGSLPAGLTLNTSTGAVTGTPTTAGSYNFTLSLTDDNGDIGDLVDYQAISLTINAASGNSGVSSSSTNNGNITTPTCSDASPHGVSSIFQFDVFKNSLTLYFTPILNNENYYISYSAKASAEDYGLSVKLSASGVQEYTLNDLDPNTTYYFKVRGQNGCKTGEWSMIKSATTLKNLNFVESSINMLIPETFEDVEEVTVKAEAKNSVISEKNDKEQINNKDSASEKGFVQSMIVSSGFNSAQYLFVAGASFSFLILLILGLYFIRKS